jgi:hypothetical protein
VVGPESTQGFINLLAELDLGAMGIAISRQPGYGSPVVTQHAKIVHRPSALVHAGAKNFDSPGVIELAIQVNGYRADQTLKIGAVHVGNALVSTKPVNRFPSNRPQEISFEVLNRLVVGHGAGRRVNGRLKNLRSLCILSQVANYHKSRTLPNPVSCLDQPAINHTSEAVAVGNPQSRLSAIQLIHGSRGDRIEQFSSMY